MSLDSLDLKYSYDSDEDDILNDFYIPALSNAISYKRISGFFSSNALAIAARGIAYFIKNDGDFRLITSVQLSEEDFTKIKETTQNQMLFYLEEKFLEEVDALENELMRDHVKMMGWMLKTGHLEMKIALTAGGIQHQKIGIFEGNEGHTVSFSGSDNETKKGWIDNIEEFHVFCSWRQNEMEHINDITRRFDKYWHDKAQRARVFPISEAIKDKLIKIAPKDDDEFETLSLDTTRNLLAKHKDSITKRKKQAGPISNNKNKYLSLRNYQKDAVDAWFENKRKGIFEMATGTGKTEAAIGVIDRLINSKEKIIIIITVWGQSLLEQWINKLKFYGYGVKGASSDQRYSNWQEELGRDILNVSCGYRNHSIVVTTYQTFSSKKFTDLIQKMQGNVLLICDEVHHVGAPELQKGLVENYNFRLGLSATPDRWFDEIGTALIRSYFDKTVYEFSMKKAMDEINPDTGKPYLCSYKYYPILVELSAEENEEYIKLTKEIGRRYHTTKLRKIDDEKLTGLLIKRSNIKNNAHAKYDELKIIVPRFINQMNYCLIYCSGKQMDYIKLLLNQYKIIYHEFTQYTTPKIRQDILLKFEEGRKSGGYDVLLAIDCLNEGIDIPSARMGIFLENSQNPIEFIQRRGRLLRPHADKKEAILFDFIVIPNFYGLEENYKELEKRELQKEYNRLVEFAKLAKNTQEALKVMEKIADEYNLVVMNG